MKEDSEISTLQTKTVRAMASDTVLPVGIPAGDKPRAPNTALANKKSTPVDTADVQHRLRYSRNVQGSNSNSNSNSNNDTPSNSNSEAEHRQTKSVSENSRQDTTPTTGGLTLVSSVSSASPAQKRFQFYQPGSFDNSTHANVVPEPTHRPRNRTDSFGSAVPEGSGANNTAKRFNFYNAEEISAEETRQRQITQQHTIPIQKKGRGADDPNQPERTQLLGSKHRDKNRKRSAVNGKKNTIQSGASDYPNALVDKQKLARPQVQIIPDLTETGPTESVDSHTDEILRSLQETEQQRNQNRGSRAASSSSSKNSHRTSSKGTRSNGKRNGGTAAKPKDSAQSREPDRDTQQHIAATATHDSNGSNPYEDAIMEALKLLRRHRNESGVPASKGELPSPPITSGGSGSSEESWMLKAKDRPKTPREADRVLQSRRDEDGTDSDSVNDENLNIVITDGHDDIFVAARTEGGVPRQTSTKATAVKNSSKRDTRASYPTTGRAGDDDDYKDLILSKVSEEIGSLPVTPAASARQKEQEQQKIRERQERMAKYTSTLNAFKTSNDSGLSIKDPSLLRTGAADTTDQDGASVPRKDSPDGASHTTEDDSAVQRGVEKVLLAILQRAHSSRGRAAVDTRPSLENGCGLHIESTDIGLITAMEDLLSSTLSDEDKASSLPAKELAQAPAKQWKSKPSSVVDELLAEDDEHAESTYVQPQTEQQSASWNSEEKKMPERQVVPNSSQEMSANYSDMIESALRSRESGTQSADGSDNRLKKPVSGADSENNNDNDNDNDNDNVDYGDDEEDVDDYVGEDEDDDGDDDGVLRSLGSGDYESNDAEKDGDEQCLTGDDEGTLEGVLGPLCKKAGGTTGVVLESSSPNIGSRNGRTGADNKDALMGSISDAFREAGSVVSHMVGNVHEQRRQQKQRESSAAPVHQSQFRRDHVSTEQYDDTEALELMRTLCAHLLPFGVDGQSNQLLEAIPAWDEADPNEAGYRIIRLTKLQLVRVERAFEWMIHEFKVNSENRLNGMDRLDPNFEKELKAAEQLLDDEERRIGAVQHSGSSHSKSSSKAKETMVQELPVAESTDSSFHISHPDFPGVKPAGQGEMGDLEYFHLPIIFKSHVTGFEPTKDLILEPGNVVAGQYLIENELGSAAFSTAYRCTNLNADGREGTDNEVCLKVIKNTKDFFDQSLDEIKILELLRQTGKCQDNHVIEMKSFFYHREHLIIVTELLRQNLFEFGKFILDNNEEPYFTIPRLAYITRQCLIALKFVHSLGLVHSDVKPENILLGSYSRAQVKLIDFGSSCYLTDRQSSYIQSRSYRAPEVILGLPYDGKIDVWSLGCVVSEMFTGEVTFQNDSIVSMLSRIEAICGPFPRHMIAQGSQSGRFFTKSGLLYENVDDPEQQHVGNPLDEPVTDHDHDTQFDIFQPKNTSLAARLGFSRDLMDDPLPAVSHRRLQRVFTDFVSQLLTIDPDSRPTAEEALSHPWMLYAASLTDDDIKYPSTQS